MEHYLMDNWSNFSHKERYAKATHYYNTDLDRHRSLLGFIDNYGNFISVLISIHRSKARKEFQKYDCFKMKKK